MNLRTIIFALIALVMASGTALLLKGYLKSQRGATQVTASKAPKAKPKPAMEILVAAKPLPAGHLIKPGDLVWRAWPRKGRMPAYIVKPPPPKPGKPPPAKSAANGQAAKPAPANPLVGLNGAVVRFGIAAGEPIVAGRVVKPGTRGFMAAVLRPGMRAVSVPINSTSGISGFIFPGDRVDLIVTHSVKVAGAQLSTSKVSETVLTGIRVLAIDQRVDDQNAKPAIGKTATLEVTPKQAEIIAVAVQIGSVTLSLRSLASGGGNQRAARRGRSFTRDSDVSRFLKPQRRKKRKGTVAEQQEDGTREVHVLRADKATTEKFGAEDEKKK